MVGIEDGWAISCGEVVVVSSFWNWGMLAGVAGSSFIIILEGFRGGSRCIVPLQVLLWVMWPCGMCRAGHFASPGQYCRLISRRDRVWASNWLDLVIISKPSVLCGRSRLLERPISSILHPVGLMSFRLGTHISSLRSRKRPSGRPDNLSFAECRVYSTSPFQVLPRAEWPPTQYHKA